MEKSQNPRKRKRSASVEGSAGTGRGASTQDSRETPSADVMPTRLSGRAGSAPKEATGSASSAGAHDEPHIASKPNSSKGSGSAYHDFAGNASQKQVKSRRQRQKKKDKELRRDARTEAERYVDGKAPLEDASLYKGEGDRKLRAQMKKVQGNLRAAAFDAAAVAIVSDRHEAGMLEPEHELERTWKMTQRELRAEVDEQTQNKMFDLTLDAMGPYNAAYSRNGAHLLLGGMQGHVAMVDWRETKHLTCEFHVNETIRDICFLHNETLFATAQKKYVYIYDNQGTEIHALKKHIDVNRIDFLPYHMLLASVGNAGYLKYQDVSTGQLVSELPTKNGPCDAMRQNAWNACMSLGHHNGTVTMWAPKQYKPLVKMLCHKGPIAAVAHDPLGRYMATAGVGDTSVKIWDLRTYKLLHTYFSEPPARSLDISQKGMLAVGTEFGVQIWSNALAQKARDPYMKWKTPLHGANSGSAAASAGLTSGHGRREGQPSSIRSLRFAPYEDILGIGSSSGFSSILVPGSGEPNYDAFEANPYQTTKQRQEQEVKQLLDKLQPDMIGLNPDFIGTVDRTPKEIQTAAAALEREAAADESGGKAKKRARGRSKIGRQLKRKQHNVWDENREKLLQKRDDERKTKRQRTGSDAGDDTSVLDRFAKKW